MSKEKLYESVDDPELMRKVWGDDPSHPLDDDRQWDAEQIGSIQQWANEQSRPRPEPKTYARKDSAALIDALYLEGIDVRYNIRSSCVEYSINQGAWKPADDLTESELRDRIASQHKYRTNRGDSDLRYGRDSWDEAINAHCASHRVDPFVAWLRSLKEWDGVPRIDHVLGTVFGCDDTPLNRWASRYPFVGAVERSMIPGVEIKQFPILVGDQGIGKSPFLANLFPHHQQSRWFSDSLKFCDTPHRQLESILGFVLIEISEMTGSTRADQESMKSFISRRNDSLRLAYARRTETHPRRCVFVGTADRSDVLPNDPSGLTRFVPVECRHGYDVEDLLGKYREQLWAEAWERVIYRKERTKLPRELMDDQKDQAELFRNADTVLEDAVLTMTEGLAEITIGRIISRWNGDQQWCNMGQLSNSPVDQKRIASALRQAGYDRVTKKREGKVVRVWTKR